MIKRIARWNKIHYCSWRYSVCFLLYLIILMKGYSYVCFFLSCFYNIIVQVSMKSVESASQLSDIYA